MHVAQVCVWNWECPWPCNIPNILLYGAFVKFLCPRKVFRIKSAQNFDLQKFVDFDDQLDEGQVRSEQKEVQEVQYGQAPGPVGSPNAVYYAVRERKI